MLQAVMMMDGWRRWLLAVMLPVVLLLFFTKEKNIITRK